MKKAIYVPRTKGEDSPKMQAKKAKMRAICFSYHNLRRSEKLTRSQAMRKAWIHEAMLIMGYMYNLDMFDHTNIKLLNKFGEQVGAIKLLQEGYLQATTRRQFKKILKNRKDAIAFAVSYEKSKNETQLPMF